MGIALILLMFVVFILLFVGCESFCNFLTKERMCNYDNHEWEAWTCQCELDAPRQKMIICKKCGKAYIHNPGVKIVCEGLGARGAIDIERIWRNSPNKHAFKINGKYAMFYDKDINPELRKDK